jgi:hypothetical protein
MSSGAKKDRFGKRGVVSSAIPPHRGRGLPRVEPQPPPQWLGSESVHTSQGLAVEGDGHLSLGHGETSKNEDYHTWSGHKEPHNLPGMLGGLSRRLLNLAECGGSGAQHTALATAVEILEARS